ncbi:hypothetical protein ColLi_00122 [Colletotrichum liriopes]|uniref:Uncharacterized protein n=1 Tax=Colletotrichum liriopes TaxID=708192 RepID=A0AA37GAV0_9PEZI|nr:hypothetical protein ColLi_00122 [Colletotrichum liriopes]
MKNFITIILVGAFAAAVNGVPIANNPNMAITKTAQAGGVVYGLVPHRFDKIQGPSGKMPDSVAGAHSSLLDAPTPTEIKVDTLWPTYTATGTFTGLYTIHVTGTEAAPAPFQTLATERMAKMTPTVCILRYDPHSTRINDCIGKVSKISTMKRTHVPGMSIPTSFFMASPTISNSAHWRDDDVYWWKLCGQILIGFRPAECATMAPPPFAAGPLPTLELTTISSMVTTSTTKETNPTTSVMTSTLNRTNKDLVSAATTTVTQTKTKDPEIEYTFARFDPALIMTRHD